MRWDLFCHVVDNYGDVGVCWRLAADLGARGHAVRLWIDDPSALAWMAPRGAPSVVVRHWEEAAAPDVGPGDVVIEAFGCDPSPAFVAAMAAAPVPPVWINLEYLSAEDYVERSHGLPSPVSAGPGAGLRKWFYYPGFTPRTGGLIREPGLMAARAATAVDTADPAASVFCYRGAPLERLAAAWPGRFWLAPGAAQTLNAPRAERLPWTSQGEYDRLLWRASLNFVRGEDSFVRAQWAGTPFVWQIYPQADGVHAVKLEAFLARFLEGAEPTLAAEVRALWRAWNGLGPWPDAWPDRARWQRQCECWRAGLLAQDDLVTQLQRFVGARRRDGLK